MGLHRIHLRRPWGSEVIAGAVCWRRRFGRPTGLATADRLWIVVENPSQAGTVELNGVSLGAFDDGATSSRFEVTGQLDLGNELLLRLSASGDARLPSSDSPPGAISIEIQSP
jgi:beta-galactosidase/beta-glucuronidase